jgi:hypothetical protein
VLAKQKLYCLSHIHFSLVILEMRSHELYSWTSFKPPSSQSQTARIIGVSHQHKASLPLLIYSLGFNKGSCVMTLSDPRHSPKAPPLHTIVRWSLHPLNTWQWGLQFSTWSLGGHSTHIQTTAPVMGLGQVTSLSFKFSHLWNGYSNASAVELSKGLELRVWNHRDSTETTGSAQEIIFPSGWSLISGFLLPLVSAWSEACCLLTVSKILASSQFGFCLADKDSIEKLLWNPNPQHCAGHILSSARTLVSSGNSINNPTSEANSVIILICHLKKQVLRESMTCLQSQIR